MTSIHKLAVIGAAIACLSVLGIELLTVFPTMLDDAFITFRYGYNLANGLGLVWNSGEAPVEGYTSTFAVIVAALSIKAGIYPLFTAKLVGVGCALTTVLIFLVCGNALRARERLLAAMLLVMSPDVAYYAASGMENCWPLPAIAYLVVRHLELETFTPVTYAVIGCLLAVLCYVRPEGHLFALGFAALHMWRYTNAQLSRRDLLLLLAPLLLLVGTLHIARYVWYGDLLPNTYYAKHTGGRLADTLVTGTSYLGAKFVPIYGPVWVLAVLFCLTDLRSSSALYLALLTTFPVYVLAVGGDDESAFPAGARLLIPIIPVICVCGAKCLSVALKRPWPFLAGTLAVMSVVASINGLWYLNTIKAMYGLNSLSAGIRQQVVTGSRHHLRFLMMPGELALSRYLEKTVRPDEFVALPWTGRVPFETHLPTIDLLGLNDRHIAQTRKPQRGIDVKYDATYVLERRPRVICENVRTQGIEIADFGSLTDAELFARGAFKAGQRELFRSPILALEYRIDTNAPVEGCFRRLRP